MQNSKIYEYMIAERKSRIGKNINKINSLTAILESDSGYYFLKNRLEYLEAEKNRLNNLLVSNEAHYNKNCEEQTEVAISINLQGKNDQIASFMEREILARKMAETASTESKVPKIIRNFIKYCKYKKQVSYEETKEEVFFFELIKPFLNMYEALSYCANEIHGISESEKYLCLATAYQNNRLNTLKEANNLNDKFEKEHSFRLNYKDIQNKVKKDITAKEEDYDTALSLMAKVKERRSVIEKEIERLLEENRAYYSQISKLEEEVVEPEKVRLFPRKIA